ncbi:putative malate dehydrogenase 1B [Periophthalmus magnuspinnatus]|uniref:putative malate dehydrogenase 1B n=1 Tax=Periophthalmus magnuspinnatus TaxID=409849 RepID=UPI0024369A93|nr:putative malate dehydrogenase 1B [Periophthalmus magnuspinnatus]
MARFVLAGKADCPCYAKAEYLADTCQKCLPDFSLRKIPIHPEQWQAWLDQICFSNSWTHTHSPLVWREVGLGSKGLLLGGLSDFMEHCQAYYNMTVELPSELMLKISQENMAAILDQNQEQEHLHTIKPLHVWICSALSPVAPFLISELLCDPEILPKSSLISLHLLHPDLGLVLDQLRALQMETQDLAAPRLHQVSIYTSLLEAFTDADLVLFLDDGVPQTSKELDQDLDQGVDQDLKQLIAQDLDKYPGLDQGVDQGLDPSLDKGLDQECPRVNRKSFVTVATHLENHARVQIADKLKVRAQDVHGLLIWGDVCGRFFVDVQRAEVHNSDRGITPPGDLGLPLPHLLQLRSWCEMELQSPVSDHPGALCSAHNLLCVLKAWDSPGTVLSAGVHCSGLLDLPEGLVLSVPVRFSDGSWTFVSDLNLHKKIRETLLECTKEQTRNQD